MLYVNWLQILEIFHCIIYISFIEENKPMLTTN